MTQVRWRCQGSVVSWCLQATLWPEHTHMPHAQSSHEVHQVPNGFQLHWWCILFVTNLLYLYIRSVKRGETTYCVAWFKKRNGTHWCLCNCISCTRFFQCKCIALKRQSWFRLFFFFFNWIQSTEMEPLHFPDSRDFVVYFTLWPSPLFDTLNLVMLKMECIHLTII